MSAIDKLLKPVRLKWYDPRRWLGEFMAWRRAVASRKQAAADKQRDRLVATITVTVEYTNQGHIDQCFFDLYENGHGKRSCDSRGFSTITPEAHPYYSQILKFLDGYGDADHWQGEEKRTLTAAHRKLAE